jgi:hypothetical protein
VLSWPGYISIYFTRKQSQKYTNRSNITAFSTVEEISKKTGIDRGRNLNTLSITCLGLAETPTGDKN